MRIIYHAEHVVSAWIGRHSFRAVSQNCRHFQTSKHCTPQTINFMTVEVGRSKHSAFELMAMIYIPNSFHEIISFIDFIPLPLSQQYYIAAQKSCTNHSESPVLSRPDLGIGARSLQPLDSSWPEHARRLFQQTLQIVPRVHWLAGFLSIGICG